MNQGQIEELTHKFQADMKSKRRQQKNVQSHCEKMMIDAERQAEKDSIVKIESYKKYEKHVYRRIEKERGGRADPNE